MGNAQRSWRDKFTIAWNGFKLLFKWGVKDTELREALAELSQLSPDSSPAKVAPEHNLSAQQIPGVNVSTRSSSQQHTLNTLRDSRSIGKALTHLIQAGNDTKSNSPKYTPRKSSADTNTTIPIGGSSPNTQRR